MIVAFDRMNFREPSSLSVERLWQELLDLFCFNESIANLVTWIEPVNALTTAPETADTATFVGHGITDEAEQSAAAAVRMQAIQRGRRDGSTGEAGQGQVSELFWCGERRAFLTHNFV